MLEYQPGGVVQLRKPFHPDGFEAFGGRWEGFTHGIIVTLTYTGEEHSIRSIRSCGLYLFSTSPAFLYVAPSGLPILVDFNTFDLDRVLATGGFSYRILAPELFEQPAALTATAGGR